jgi:CRISPR/Cas system-associated exonuclease Cas4 (RecB family)
MEADVQTRRLVGLQFSQHSLQDFSDCPRRFQLRYLLGVAWPAVKAEPIEEMERRARLGQRFHLMAHQYALGIPAEQLAKGIDDEELRRWWHNFMSAPPRGLPTGLRRAEVSLSAPLESYRLTARYDLLAADPGERLFIVDWKTQRPRNPRHLLDKLQSVVYPYVLVEAGAAFNGGQAVRPEQVAMVYWFAEFPDDPLRLDYNANQHATNHERLMALIRDIETCCAEDVGTWPLTDSERKCRFCAYRSLCNRGSVAGDLDDLDEDWEPEEPFDIDLEQVAEIALL